MNRSWSFVIPFPPSQSQYYRRVGNMVKISKRGREYRDEVIAAMMEQGFDDLNIGCRLDVSIAFTPPCNRRRDLDNYFKAPLDAITHSGFWMDDSQIDVLKIFRCVKNKLGYLDFEVREL